MLSDYCACVVMCNWKDVVLFDWFNYWLRLQIATEKKKVSVKCCFFCILGIQSPNLSWGHSNQKFDMLWIGLCIQGMNMFLFHVSHLFPNLVAMENIPWVSAEVTIKSNFTMLTNAVTPSTTPVCLALFSSLSSSHTQTAFSHSKDYCVVRSRCCVSHSLWAW